MEPFAEPERFIFPEGIGPVECVHVEHEEVTLVPRWLDAQRVTFKYALGDEFIGALKMLHAIGLDRNDPIRVKGVRGRAARRGGGAGARSGHARRPHARAGGRGHPRDGPQGRRGRARSTSTRCATRRRRCASYGLQPVAWQTGFNPVVAMELLAEGAWQGAGVLVPEAFDPDPYLAILDRDGIHHAMMEIEPGHATA